MNALDLLYIPVAAAYAPRLLAKKRGGWAERFGRIAPLPPAREGAGRVLVHGVSVGEINALRTLVPLLAERHDVVVTATTDTGIERARALFRPPVHVVRYPLDLSASVRRFLDAVRPDAVALAELELWPNFVRECGRRKIPVCVINGRLSARSFRGYRRIRGFMKHIFGALEFAAVQDEAYAERFRAMGVPPDRVVVTGSMKWDAISLSAPAQQADPKALALAAELGIDLARPLVVAGSTGPGEEALLHEALRNESIPSGVQLLCAPRRTERFDEAAAALPGCVRRTARTVAPAGTTRFLLDTIGELRQAYALATVVVVGRSFFDLHGSDPIEPAALGKPVIIGPAHSDFASIVATFRAAGGLVVAERTNLAAEIARLLASEPARRELAWRAVECITREQGASRRHAELIAGIARRDGEGRSNEHVAHAP
jgi:3-deoxy-D-manno-octulosonic-acid transferase